MRTQHARRYKRKIQRRDAIIAGLTIASITGTVLPAWAARTPPPDKAHCATKVVQRGDTVWRLFDGDMARATALNTHITDLNRVYPGDQLVTSCPDNADAIQWQPMTTDLGLIDVTPWLDERDPDGRVSWRAVIANLYTRDVRGNDLLALAAITEPESARRMDRPGDTTIANNTWGNSIGAWQIRSLRADKGTGNTRDEDRLATIAGNADAAVALYRSALQKRAEGKIHPVTKQVWTPFDDWTAAQKGWHIGHIDTVRAVAESMGVLDA